MKKNTHTQNTKKMTEVLIRRNREEQTQVLRDIMNRKKKMASASVVEEEKKEKEKEASPLIEMAQDPLGEEMKEFLEEEEEEEKKTEEKLNGIEEEKEKKTEVEEDEEDEEEDKEEDAKTTTTATSILSAPVSEVLEDIKQMEEGKKKKKRGVKGSRSLLLPDKKVKRYQGPEKGAKRDRKISRLMRSGTVSMVDNVKHLFNKATDNLRLDQNLQAQIRNMSGGEFRYTNDLRRGVESLLETHFQELLAQTQQLLVVSNKRTITADFAATASGLVETMHGLRPRNHPWVSEGHRQRFYKTSFRNIKINRDKRVKRRRKQKYQEEKKNKKNKKEN